MKLLINPLFLVAASLPFLQLPACAVDLMWVFPAGDDVPGSGGYFDPVTTDGAARLSAFEDISTYISSTLATPGVVEVEVTVFDDPSSSTRATGGQFFSGIPGDASGVFLGDVQAEIFGGDVMGTTGFMTFNAGKTDWFLGSDATAIGADDVDFRSAILHEATHVLGWGSFIKADDLTSALSDVLMADPSGMWAGVGEVYSLYDTLLADSAGEPLIVAGSANPAAMLGMSPVEIVSPGAIAGNGGELVPTVFTPPTPFSPPSFDFTHLGVPDDDSVMNTSLADAAIERTWTAVDLGVLTDLGFTIVPEPSTGILALFGLVLIARRSR